MNSAKGNAIRKAIRRKMKGSCASAPAVEPAHVVYRSDPLGKAPYLVELAEAGQHGKEEVAER
jgi:hypothetical protein